MIARSLIALAFIAGSSAPAAAESDLFRSTSGNRILGGQKASATLDPIPFMLSLQVASKKGTYFHWCGASLIAPEWDGDAIAGWRIAFDDGEQPIWAVTAAHCFFDREGNRLAGPFQIMGGILNLKDEAQLSRALVQPVTDIILPESDAMHFDRDTLENDIALIRLGAPKPTERGPILRPAPVVFALSTQSWSAAPYARAITSGWGRYEESFYSPDLLEVALPVADIATCNRALEARGREERLYPGMLCAGYLTGGFDACTGDSGGPLFYRPTEGGRSPDPLIVGIVSWGIHCGLHGLFGVYTDAAYFEPWIKESIAAAER